MTLARDVPLEAQRPSVDGAPLWARWAGATLALVVVGWIAAGFVDLVAPLVPQHVANRIGNAIWAELKPQLATDREKQVSAIEATAKGIAERLRLPGPFRAGILASEEANALALPGGTLIFTTRLLDHLANENELTFAVAHLLGHVAEREDLKQMGRGLAAAVLLDFVGVGQGALAREQLRHGLMTRQKFKNKQEAAADRIGLLMLNAAYGQVTGADSFLEIFETVGWATSHFNETPTSAQARRRLLTQVITDEGWSSDGAVAPLPY